MKDKKLNKQINIEHMKIDQMDEELLKYNSPVNKLIRDLVIILICSLLGVILKKLINPYANIATGLLHIPGGISTAFSLMPLVIASGVTNRKWSASAGALTQGAIALAMGTIGSMGFLAPVAYIIPGIIIDLVMLISSGEMFGKALKLFSANILSSIMAAIIADILVFRLPVKVFAIYIIVSALSGALAGVVASLVGSKAPSDTPRNSMR